MEFLLDLLAFTLKLGIGCFLISVVISLIAKIIKEKGLADDRVTFADRFESEEKESMLLDKILMSDDDYSEQWKGVDSRGAKGLDKSLFVLSFKGDKEASESYFLSREIDSVILNAKEHDEALILMESGGGTVNGYGYVSSLIQRLKSSGIKVTVCVDQIAASGGYLAACVADKLYAAEFAYIGSVGVVAEIPNIHELLKKHGVSVVQVTAGENKRNVTLTGEITNDDKDKLRTELVDIHEAFKNHVSCHRPQVEIDNISTGDVWLGKRALDLNLVDGVKISDEFIDEMRMNDFNIIDVVYQPAKTPTGFIGSLIGASIDKAVEKVLTATLNKATHY